MTDLRTRFRGADRIPAPHLWQEITSREPSLHPLEPRPTRRILVATFSLLIAAAAIGFAVRAFTGNGQPAPASSPSLVPKANGSIYYRVVDKNGLGEITAVEPDGTGQRVVFPPGSPLSQGHIAWSADGRQIAFDGYFGSHIGISTADPDGSAITPITDGLNDSWPSWSLDGTKIVFASTRYDGGVDACPTGIDLRCPTDIYVMNGDGSNVTRLTTDPASEWNPVWSPDGTRIAFVRGDSDTEIVVMNADGSGARTVTSTEGGSAFNPSWSPDGSKIVFGSIQYEDWGIFVANADGTDEHALLFGDSIYATDPARSPDGSLIAFTGSVDGDSGLYVLQPDGSGVTRLANESQDSLLSDVAWQPLPVEASPPAVTETPSPEFTKVSDPLISASVKTGGGAIAAGEDGVWVGVQRDVGGDYVARIDPRTNDVVATIPVNSSPWEIAVGAGSVWVTGYAEDKSGTLQRIDPATNQVVATITVDPSGHPGPVAAGDDAVWVDVGDTESDALVRIDPATNRVVSTVPLPGPGTAYVDDLQVVGDTVWAQETVSTQGGNSDHGGDVIRIDGTTNQVVATIPAHAQNMAAGLDAVWVSDRPEKEGSGWILSEIDPRTNQIVQGPFSLPNDTGGFGPLYVDQAGVWLDGYDEQERVLVIHVDAQTHEIDASSKPIQSYYTGAAFDPATRSFWVSALPSVTRLDLP